MIIIWMLRLREKKRREGRLVKREREGMHCWLIREIGWSTSEEKESQCLMAREKRDGEKEGIWNFKKKKKMREKRNRHVLIFKHHRWKFCWWFRHVTNTDKLFLFLIVFILSWILSQIKIGKFLKTIPSSLSSKYSEPSITFRWNDKSIIDSIENKNLNFWRDIPLLILLEHLKPYVTFQWKWQFHLQFHQN